MDILKESHNNVFLRDLQTLLQQSHNDSQAIEVDGKSLDIPKVVAVARCSRKLLPGLDRS